MWNMFSSRLCASVCLAVLMSAADKPATSKRYVVVVGRAAGPLELYAASELRKYLKSIYGLDASLANAVGTDCDGYLILGGPGSNPETSAALAGIWPKVSDQGIVLKRVSLSGKPALVLGGEARQPPFGPYMNLSSRLECSSFSRKRRAACASGSVSSRAARRGRGAATAFSLLPRYQ